jgi:uncharacterized protein YjbJ (UPF0337 family)
MNWDCIEGEWKQRRGKAVQHWGKIMNDELAAIAGKYEQLVGQLQEGYGRVVEESRMRAAKCRDAEEQLKKSERKLMEMQKSMIRNEKSGRGGRKNSGRTHR